MNMFVFISMQQATVADCNNWKWKCSSVAIVKTITEKWVTVT